MREVVDFTEQIHQTVPIVYELLGSDSIQDVVEVYIYVKRMKQLEQCVFHILLYTSMKPPFEQTQHNTTQYNSTQYNTMQCNAIQYNTTQHNP